MHEMSNSEWTLAVVNHVVNGTAKNERGINLVKQKVFIAISRYTSLQGSTTVIKYTETEGGTKMSLCRSRLFSASDLLRNFEEIPALNLNEEEIDSPVDSSFHDASMESISPSPRGLQGITDRGSPICWNPDFASPTPAPSPMQSNRVTRSRRRSPKTSPIPLNFDADDEDTDRVPPLHGPSSKKSPGNTPPHKKLKALRLFDTPHTPKSLLQKAQRRTVRSNRTKLFNVFGDKKHRAVPERPLANVNPFTPNNNTVQSRGKRPRPFHER